MTSAVYSRWDTGNQIMDCQFPRSCRHFVWPILSGNLLVSFNEFRCSALRKKWMSITYWPLPKHSTSWVWFPSHQSVPTPLDIFIRHIFWLTIVQRYIYFALNHKLSVQRSYLSTSTSVNTGQRTVLDPVARWNGKTNNNKKANRFRVNTSMWKLRIPY